MYAIAGWVLGMVLFVWFAMGIAQESKTPEVMVQFECVVDDGGIFTVPKDWTFVSVHAGDRRRHFCEGVGGVCSPDEPTRVTIRRSMPATDGAVSIDKLPCSLTETVGKSGYWRQYNGLTDDGALIDRWQ